MSFDDDEIHGHDDGDDAPDAGDTFSRIVQALQALRARLNEVATEAAATTTSDDWAEQLASLRAYADEMAAQVGESADLAFEAQDDFIQTLAAQATEQLATALREAADAFLATPWAELETPETRVAALEATWDEACDAGWHLQAVLEDVR